MLFVFNHIEICIIKCFNIKIESAKDKGNQRFGIEMRESGNSEDRVKEQERERKEKERQGERERKKEREREKM